MVFLNCSQFTYTRGNDILRIKSDTFLLKGFFKTNLKTILEDVFHLTHVKLLTVKSFEI